MKQFKILSDYKREEEASPPFHARHVPGNDVAVLAGGISKGRRAVIIKVKNQKLKAPTLQWGIVGDDGAWRVPPEDIWPEGTSPYLVDGNMIGCVRTEMNSSPSGARQAKIPALPEGARIAFVIYDPEAGYDNNQGKNYTILFDRARRIESLDSRYYVNVEQINYYPAEFDFLLSRFPHTIAIKLSSKLPGHLQDQINAWIEFKGSNAEGTVQMLPHREETDCILEGAFCPSQPGVYHFRVILSVGGEQFVVEQGERNILAPRPHERWTQGPLAVEIDPGLLLGNAAAAADPQFLEERVRALGERAPQVAVLNAAEERQPRPLLLNTCKERKIHFVYRQFPFTDFSHHPMNKEGLWEAVKWIHEQMKRGPVFVHCHAGIGRSGSLIVAYLRLFRHPDRSYDQVVEMVKEAVREQDHDIFPHLGLPETLKELQADERRRKELAELSGKESYDYVEEPESEVKAVSFAGGYEVGQTRTAHEGEEIVVQARVEGEGAEPRGVFVHTNLGGDKKERLMRRVEGNIYQAEVQATQAGTNYWLTASATPRKYDHPVRRTWIGGDIYFNVVR